MESTVRQSEDIFGKFRRNYVLTVVSQVAALMLDFEEGTPCKIPYFHVKLCHIALKL